MRRCGDSAVCLLLLGLVGCGGLTGTWAFRAAEPNREIFAIERLELNRDQTFTATITIEGRTRAERGVYERRGWALRLRPESGGVREYRLRRRGDTLELATGEQRVTLGRSDP